MTDVQNFFLLKETYVALRSELQFINKEIIESQKTALLFSGAVYAWIFSNSTRFQSPFHRYLFLIPVVLHVYILIKCIFSILHSNTISGYLEKSLLFDYPTVSWEGYVAANGHGDIFATLLLIFWSAILLISTCAVWKFWSIDKLRAPDAPNEDRQDGAEG